MFDGAHLNVTEDRSVLHVALRAPRDYVSLAFLCWKHAWSCRSVSHCPQSIILSCTLYACMNARSFDALQRGRIQRLAQGRPMAQVINSEGKNVVPDVWKVLDKIKAFTDKVGHPAPAIFISCRATLPAS